MTCGLGVPGRAPARQHQCPVSFSVHTRTASPPPGCKHHCPSRRGSSRAPPGPQAARAAPRAAGAHTPGPSHPELRVHSASQRPQKPVPFSEDPPRLELHRHGPSHPPPPTPDLCLPLPPTYNFLMYIRCTFFYTIYVFFGLLSVSLHKVWGLCFVPRCTPSCNPSPWHPTGATGKKPALHAQPWSRRIGSSHKRWRPRLGLACSGLACSGLATSEARGGHCWPHTPAP